MANAHWKRLLLCQRVVVNLVDGSAVQGVLTDQMGPLLVLQDAELIAPGAGGPQPVDGRIVIDRERVTFIQAP